MVHVQSCFDSTKAENFGDDPLAVGQRSSGVESATNITISNYVSRNNDKSLFGSGCAAGQRAERLTIVDSWLDGATQRNPYLCGWKDVHMYNCYVSNWGVEGVTVQVNNKHFFLLTIFEFYFFVRSKQIPSPGVGVGHVLTESNVYKPVDNPTRDSQNIAERGWQQRNSINGLRMNGSIGRLVDNVMS
jgi:pectate lyase